MKQKTKTKPMNYDLHSVGFSIAGSILVLRMPPPTKDRAEGLYLQTVPNQDFMRVSVLRGDQPVEYDHVAGPASLVLKPTTGSGKVEFVFESPAILRVRTTGVALCLEMPLGQVLARGRDRWQINRGLSSQLLLSRLSGTVAVDAPWNGVGAEHVKITVVGEIAIEAFTTTAPADHARPSFVQCRQQARDAFESFLANLPAVPPRYRTARELAGYILWSAIVNPQGHYRRPAMLMSKNRMSRIWGWDHCFNAMALAKGHPALAWDQMQVMFDVQDKHGALPDSISTEKIIWTFCKPPVHGWALRWMLEANPKIAGRRQLAAFYPQLTAWTNWWLDSRDDDGDGICQYHHGNDSGWDNATCFTVDMPAEGPDLAAFLVTQMDMLVELATRLEKPDEAKAWQERSDRMLRGLIEHFWRDDRFVATQSGSHRSPDKGDSLIPFTPLLLGRRLPAEITRTLVTRLFEPDRFLTAHGLATENLKSALYDPNGWWRGGIWAPSTHMIYDGLRQLGEDDHAREVARRFCETCRTSGFAECFNSLTGAPVGDKAYTWTASVFLLLANDLLTE